MKKYQEWLNETYGPATTPLFQQVSAAIQRDQGGQMSGSQTFSSDYFKKIGFNVPQLLQAGIVQPAPGGNYQLNKDLASTQGRLGTAPPPPAVPQKPVPIQTKMQNWLAQQRRGMS